MALTLDTGYRRSPVDHRDWQFRALAMPRTVRPLPRTFEVDFRSPIRAYDQDGPSCVGWSTATAMKVLERVDHRRTLEFDGQAFYNKIALPGGGAYIREALDLARNEGVPQQGTGKLHRIEGYAAINPRDHEAVKYAIVHGRGVLIGFMVTRKWAEGGGAEFTDDGDEDLGGHGMYISGYEEVGPIGLNTWSEWWSDDGRAPLPWPYWDQNVWECWTLVDHNE